MVADRQLQNYSSCLGVFRILYAFEDHVMLQLVEGCLCQIHVINYLNRKDQLILLLLPFLPVRTSLYLPYAEIEIYRT